MIRLLRPRRASGHELECAPAPVRGEGSSGWLAKAPTTEVAVLDLGSNTFHLEHFLFDREGAYRKVFDHKRAPGIGAQIFADGYINDASRKAALESIGALATQSRRHRRDRRTQLTAVATSALRSAENGAPFMREVKARFGIDVRVLAPQEEALRAYQGASLGPEIGGRRVVVVDIGGGSAELAAGEGTRCVAAASLPLGAVRAARQVGCAERLDREGWRRLSTLVRAQLRALPADVIASRPEVLCFASGTARAVRQLVTRSGDAPGKLGALDTTALYRTLNHFVDRSPGALLEAGVETGRARSVLVAAAIILQLAEHMGSPPMLTTDRGLRDGVALDYIQRVRAAASLADPPSGT